MARLLLLSISLVLFAWFINVNIPVRRPPLVNYDSTTYFNPYSDGLWLLPNESLGLPEPGYLHASNLLLPKTKGEIVHMIKSAIVSSDSPVDSGAMLSRPKRIRVVGSGHSWSSVALSDRIQMSLHNYKGVVSIDQTLKQVTVLGGTTLNELNIILEENGLAMTNLGSISDQTVAGAISTGTHGTGVEFGNLATLVTRMELITSEGKLLSLSVEDDQDTFKAAQVSIGLLGVISQVTIQCETAFNLEETSSMLTFDQCLDTMEPTVRSSQHVKYWLELHTGQCALFETKRTMESPRDNPNHTLETIKNYGLEVVTLLSSWLPAYTHNIMTTLFTLVDLLSPNNRVDTSYKVFNIPHYFPVHNEAEVIIGLEDCSVAIRELRNTVLQEKIPLNFIVEVRFVKADDIWMSPNYKRDSCHITLCIYNPSDATKTKYLYGGFKALSRFRPRVHWGKYFNLTSHDLESMYPKFRDFLRVRSRLDPSGMFLNQQLAQAFGLKHLL